jgi:hypothetical protein
MVIVIQLKHVLVSLTHCRRTLCCSDQCHPCCKWLSCPYPARSSSHWYFRNLNHIVELTDMLPVNPFVQNIINNQPNRFVGGPPPPIPGRAFIPDNPGDSRQRGGGGFRPPRGSRPCGPKSTTSSQRSEPLAPQPVSRNSQRVSHPALRNQSGPSPALTAPRRPPQARPPIALATPTDFLQAARSRQKLPTPAVKPNLPVTPSTSKSGVSKPRNLGMQGSS